MMCGLSVREMCVYSRSSHTVQFLSGLSCNTIFSSWKIIISGYNWKEMVVGVYRHFSDIVSVFKKFASKTFCFVLLCYDGRR